MVPAEYWPAQTWPVCFPAPFSVLAQSLVKKNDTHTIHTGAGMCGYMKLLPTLLGFCQLAKLFPGSCPPQPCLEVCLVQWKRQWTVLLCNSKPEQRVVTAPLPLNGGPATHWRTFPSPSQCTSKLMSIIVDWRSKLPHRNTNKAVILFSLPKWHLTIVTN